MEVKSEVMYFAQDVSHAISEVSSSMMGITSFKTHYLPSSYNFQGL